MIEIEKPLWDKGFIIAGVDEAGRGPIAGPVVAAAVILKPYTEPFIKGDSKSMSPKEREEALAVIREKAVAIGTAVVDSIVIDRINILKATKLAMKRALEDLKTSFDVVISDFVTKVLRDRIMEEYHRIYPQYNFDKHKGYITREHLERIKRFNISPIHRRSFKPVYQISMF